MATQVGHTHEARAADLDWLEAHGQEVHERYAGQFIAVEGQAVIAAAPDLRSVMEIARHRGHPYPLITAVPQHPAPKRHL